MTESRYETKCNRLPDKDEAECIQNVTRSTAHQIGHNMGFDVLNRGYDDGYGWINFQSHASGRIYTILVLGEE